MKKPTLRMNKLGFSIAGENFFNKLPALVSVE